MIKGLVSIVIPCYNSEKYIKDCLDSILNQTYKKIEIIIVNDGSTDKTGEILESYKERFNCLGMQYKIINQENLGQAAAINNGLKYVTGQYLAWADSDDCYTNDAIKLMIEYLKSHKDMQFVRGEMLSFDENMEKILGHGKSKYPNQTNIFDFYLFETDSYCFPGIFLVRMEYFDKCINDREIYISRAGQNWALILPIAYKGKCGYIDKIVYHYRVREDSHSHSIKTIKDSLKMKDIVYNEVALNILNSIKMDEALRLEYIKRIKQKYKVVKSEIYIRDWIHSPNPSEVLKNFFVKNNISTIAIYGMGNLGKKVFDETKKLNVSISYAIDKNADNLNIEGLKIITLEGKIDKVDIIIITPPNFFDEIINELHEKGIYNFITLGEIIKNDKIEKGEQL